MAPLHGSMDLIKLDFEKARGRHVFLKTGLKAFLYGVELDEAVLSSRESGFGKWVYGDAPGVYGDLPEMNALQCLHKEICEIASAAIGLYRSGKIDQARTEATQIETLSVGLVTLLAELERKARQSTALQDRTDLAAEIYTNYQELIELQSLTALLNQRMEQEATGSNLAAKKAIEDKSQLIFTVMQAPVGILIMRGPDLVVKMANAKYLEIVDRKEELFIGKPLLESLPEVQDTAGPVLHEVMRTGIPFYGNEFEVTLKRFGISERCFFNFVYQPLFESNGEISGIITIATEVTSQVRIKEEILKSENQFRNLVAQSQFAKAIFKGEDMVISVANEAVLKIWRRTMEEVEGRKLLDVFPELEGQPFPEILKQVYSTGITYRGNEAPAVVDGPDGEKKHYLDFQYAPMFDIDGSVSAIMVSVNDVTEKVEARQLINDAAERLQLATEGTQLATWDLNLQTREIIYTERLNKIFGQPDGIRLTHQDLRNRVHPDDIKTIVEPAFEKAMRTGIYYYEARLVHPDKSLHWVRTQGKIIFDEAHRPQRMLGTMMDITAYKLAEISLKTSEGKFRTLADSMPQFIWTSDTSGTLNYFSKSVFDYSGLSEGQIYREGWLQIVHPDDRAENIRLWTEAIQNGTDFFCEHRFRRMDGVYRWQLSRAIPQKDPDGGILMWVGTSTDIHDSKLFIDDLEHKVQMRTRELTALNEELLRTNIELGQFAYVASHDLQEPLRKIQTFAARIVETELVNLSERGKDYFDRMQASSTRMQQLIVDLLTFSRANAVEKHFETTDVDKMLTNIVSQLQETRPYNATRIYRGRMPVLEVIVYQFEQLLTNLIGNALKFSSTLRTPEIRITAGAISGSEIPLPDANPRLKYQFISISDNGIGFEPQYKERIFQVFQRLHNKSVYEGTGIGLAICKKIVDNHNGLIDAVGVPGEGATFTVYLPGSEEELRVKS